MTQPQPPSETKEEPVNRPASRGRRAWQRCAPWVAPALLVVVAMVQIVRAHVTDLTPWKGGGFGMFSTLDGSGNRLVRLTAIAEETGEETPIRVRRPRPRALSRFANNPNDANAARVARAVAPRLGRRLAQTRAIRVAIHRATFDPSTVTLRRAPWIQYLVELDKLPAALPDAEDALPEESADPDAVPAVSDTDDGDAGDAQPPGER